MINQVLLRVRESGYFRALPMVTQDSPRRIHAVTGWQETIDVFPGAFPAWWDATISLEASVMQDNSGRSRFVRGSVTVTV